MAKTHVETMNRLLRELEESLALSRVNGSGRNDLNIDAAQLVHSHNTTLFRSLGVGTSASVNLVTECIRLIMSGDWDGFMRRMSELDNKFKAAEQETGQLDTQIGDTKKKLQALQRKRKDNVAQLEQLENEKKAMMGSGAGVGTAITTAKVAEADPDTVTINSTTAKAIPTKTDNLTATPPQRPQFVTPTKPSLFRRDSVTDDVVIKGRAGKTTVDSPALVCGDDDDEYKISVAQKSTPTPATLPLHTKAAPTSPGYGTLNTIFKESPRGFHWDCINRITAIHELFPTVVHMDGHWTDIFCGTCGANSYTAQKTEIRFYKGLGGLHNHVKAVHASGVGETMVQTVRTCKRRLVSEADVVLMLAGKEPSIPITHNLGATHKTPSPTAGARKTASDGSPTTPAPVAHMQASGAISAGVQQNLKRKLADDSSKGHTLESESPAKKRSFSTTRMSAPSSVTPERRRSSIPEPPNAEEL